MHSLVKAMNIQPSLGIGPLQGRKRKAALKIAIQEIELPWECNQDLKQKAKKIAIYAAANGLVPTNFIKELVPSVFRTQRDAKHAMAKLTAIGLAAVTYEVWRSVNVTKYEWNWLPFICEYQEHEGRNWKQFMLINGDLPGTRYGCRCYGKAIFLDELAE